MCRWAAGKGPAQIVDQAAGEIVCPADVSDESIAILRIAKTEKLRACPAAELGRETEIDAVLLTHGLIQSRAQVLAVLGY